MRRSIPLLLILAIACCAAPRGWAEDAPAAGGAPDLRELRQAIEQQGKQIQALTEEVARLTRAIEAQKASEAAAGKPVEGAAAPGTTTAVEAVKPSTEATATGDTPKVDTTAKGDAVPKAEAVGGIKHVITKGETLTSIAKHYNITVTDLKNANKIENERRIQIGQILSVPTPKPADTSDKKENP